MAFEGQARSYVIKLRNCLNQQYRLAIPFAEYNFGPFGRIFFVRDLFESLSKVLFRVIFSRLYLEICIFYDRISISGLTVR